MVVPNRTRPVSVTQIGVHVKCLLCVSSCTQDRNVATLCRKNSIYEASRKSVQGELHLQQGQMTSWSDGQMVSRSDGQMVSRSDGGKDKPRA